MSEVATEEDILQADEMVDDILKQLKDSTKNCNQLAKPSNDVHLRKEDLEQFAMDTSAELVKTTLEVIGDIKDRACASADPEDIRAFAEILKATSAAVEALNKLHISAEKNKTAKEMKAADIESRKNINTQNNQTKLLLTREEVMKELFKETKAKEKEEAIEAEVS